MAANQQLEDQLHLLSLDWIDLEPFLDLCAAPLRLDGAIAERRPSPIPEALPSVLLHGAQDVLGVFLRLVFVEQ